MGVRVVGMSRSRCELRKTENGTYELVSDVAHEIWEKLQASETIQRLNEEGIPYMIAGSYPLYALFKHYDIPPLFKPNDLDVFVCGHSRFDYRAYRKERVPGIEVPVQIVFMNVSTPMQVLYDFHLNVIKVGIVEDRFIMLPTFKLALEGQLIFNIDRCEGFYALNHAQRWFERYAFMTFFGAIDALRLMINGDSLSVFIEDIPNVDEYEFKDEYVFDRVRTLQGSRNNQFFRLRVHLDWPEAVYYRHLLSKVDVKAYTCDRFGFAKFTNVLEFSANNNYARLLSTLCKFVEDVLLGNIRV